MLRALLGSHHWATVTKGALNDAIAGVVVALADPKRGSQQERCQVFGRAVAALSVLGGHDSPLRVGARVSVQNGGSQSTSHGTLVKFVQGMSTAKVAFGGFAGTLKDVPVADVTVIDAVRPKGSWLFMSTDMCDAFKAMLAIPGAKSVPSDAAKATDLDAGKAVGADATVPTTTPEDVWLQQVKEGALSALETIVTTPPARRRLWTQGSWNPCTTRRSAP